MPAVVLTGIAPCDGESINLSWEAARAVDGARSGEATGAVRQWPGVLARVKPVLVEAVQAWIATGLIVHQAVRGNAGAWH